MGSTQGWKEQSQDLGLSPLSRVFLNLEACCLSELSSLARALELGGRPRRGQVVSMSSACLISGVLAQVATDDWLD